MNMKDLPLNQTVHCACGRDHRILTKRIEIGRNVIDQLPQWIREDGLSEKILLIDDVDTHAAAGEYTAKVLKDAGMDVRVSTLPHGTIASRESIGQIMLDVEPMPGLLIAVGTGSINDTVRLAAARLRLPYIIVGTAPSMDGYASTVSPALTNQVKITYPAVAPEMVIGDLDVLCASPIRMMAAGFGDILAKVTSHLDWLIAHLAFGEHYCEPVADMMQDALNICMASVDGLADRDEAAVRGIMEGLVLSGVAMQMVNYSRPASGAEHHMSHFLEMRDIAQGRPHSLHGDKVGVTALFMMRLYQKFFMAEPPAQGEVLKGEPWEKAMREIFDPQQAESLIEVNRSRFLTDEKRQEVKTSILENWEMFRKLSEGLTEMRKKGAEALRRAQGPVTPADLGYTRQDFQDAFRFARFVRGERPTLLTVLAEWGQLEKLTDEVLTELIDEGGL